MSKTVLGIDLDGVLYDFHDATYVYYQYLMGYEGTYKQFWTEFWPSLTKEKQDYIVSIAILYDTKVPPKEVVDFIDYAKERSEIYYITSRDESLSRITERYLRRYNFPFQENLIMTKDKANACKLYGVTHFLDDFLHQVKEVSSVTNAYLMSKPWNVDGRDKLNVVNSLEEFKEKVFNAI